MSDNAVPARAVPFWAHLLPFVVPALVLHLAEGLGVWSYAIAVAAGAALAVRFRPWRDRPVWSHVAPYVAWLSILFGWDHPTAWKYVVLTALGTGLLLSGRPWRYYPAPRLRYVPAGVAVGLLVFILWVGAETPWMQRHAPGFHEFYLRFFGNLSGFGKRPAPLTETPYAPEVCGWALSIVRLCGSAFVIAAIEEFFFRGFLYRWLMGSDFLKVDAGRFDRLAFFAVAVIFGFEHETWLAGILCGLLYGGLYVRTRDLWAPIIAHVTTNFVLGLYVLATGAYRLW
jgi:membrane protease YdiL (CAAX protease family)